MKRPVIPTPARVSPPPWRSIIAVSKKKIAIATDGPARPAPGDAFGRPFITTGE